MTLDPKQAGDDLAFMRALVEENSFNNRSFGINYFAAGFLYGLQCLINALLLISKADFSTWLWMAVGWLPTILFLIINFSTIWLNREQPFGTGTTKRALNAAFAGGGIANLLLALIFGWAAFQAKDWSIWLLFPVVVCAFQGAIWFTAAILRRHMWHGITAIGWFLSAIILGLLIDKTEVYILGLGLALFVCMALPGFMIMRSHSPNIKQA
jgi:hypothetical protein